MRSFFLSLLLSLATLGTTPALAIIKHRASALVNFELIALNQHTGANFRHARIGYHGRTDFVSLQVELDLDTTASRTTELPPLLESAFLEYRLTPKFKMLAGLQRTSFGMSFNRRDGSEQTVDRGAFDVLNFDQAPGIASVWKIHTDSAWIFGVFDRVERSQISATSGHRTFNDSPLIATRIYYQYANALHIEFGTALQVYENALDNTHATNLGVWGYFSPSVRGEFEHVWVNNVNGFSSRSLASISYMISLQLSRPWFWIFRYQSTRDVEDDLLDEFTLGFNYRVDNHNLIRLAWKQFSRQQDYQGPHTGRSGLYVQFQFQH